MIKPNTDYDNSHFTDEYHPMYCFNCHSVFGWQRKMSVTIESETLCHYCFENLEEPKGERT